MEEHMDINSEVAEKIMGWRNWEPHEGMIGWDPTHNLNQAMKIITNMNDLGFVLLVQQSINDLEQFKVTFSYYKDGRVAVMGTGEDREGNLSKAICLAALDTLGDHDDYWTTPEGIEQSR
jgi:hypothetical protein